MITLTIFYPNSEGARFDMAYYLDVHMPMSKERLGSALMGSTVDSGVMGGEQGAPPPYLVMTHMRFESIETFLEAFMPHMEELQGDMPNYTNVQPQFQFSTSQAI